MKLKNRAKISTEELRDLFISHANKLSYAKLDKKNKKYCGWVSDFGLKFKDEKKIELKLDQENDRFLLFVLAVVWSRTGQWENAAYFVSYLIHHGAPKNTKEYWKILKNCNKEREIKKVSAPKTQADASMKSKSSDSLKKEGPRSAISFRKDIFKSINILARKWDDIENELKKLRGQKSNADGWIGFMNYLRGIEGLGGGKKKIFMKIPLILRELRCQGWKEIPGEFCCVVDARVIKACEEVDIELSKHSSNINGLIRNSKKVYAKFGDLYDIPLFAYKDLKKYASISEK